MQYFLTFEQICNPPPPPSPDPRNASELLSMQSFATAKLDSCNLCQGLIEVNMEVPFP